MIAGPVIFVTVGHQMPFDRMIRLVDQWAGKHPEHSVFAQTGESTYQPQHMEFARLLERDDYAARLNQADAVIAHAGTGTIIDVLLQNKPLLVLPRLGDLGETRNDHQIGTAQHFADQGQILAAFDEQAFLQKIDVLTQFTPARKLGNTASPELLNCLQEFMAAGSV